MHDETKGLRGDYSWNLRQNGERHRRHFVSAVHVQKKEKASRKERPDAEDGLIARCFIDTFTCLPFSPKIFIRQDFALFFFSASSSRLQTPRS